MYLEIKTKKFLYYIFFIIQFLIIILLISAMKLDYIRDVIFINALVAVYIFIETKYCIFVGNYARGCMMLELSVHNFAGKYLDLYLKSAIFDKVLHIFGIYAVVLFLYSIINQIMEMSFNSKLNKFVFITLLGISLGAIFEIIEFILDVTINPRVHNQIDLIDTNLDIIADIVGALIAAFHVCLIGIQLRFKE